MTPEYGERPALSVVLVSLGDGEALVEALSALTAQANGVIGEIVIPADERVRGILAGISALPAAARVLSMGGRQSTWALRGAGVAASRGVIVATIEDHALPDPDWAAGVVAAHRGAAAAIGGVVAKRTPDDAVGWAMYFLDYGRYIPPLRGGETVWLSACNVSYKRDALDRVAHVWREEMHETDVHWALLGAGESMRLDPSLVVRLRRRITLRMALDELRSHGRRYAAGRRESVGALERLARIATVPLLPAVLITKSAAPLRRAPALIVPWARAIPAMVAMAVAWAAGEGAGYRHGGDRAPRSGTTSPAS